MDNMIMASMICCALTLCGVVLFRKIKEQNPTMSVLIVGAILLMEIFICMIFSSGMV